MTAVAAIVGFICAKAPLGASPPAARPRRSRPQRRRTPTSRPARPPYGAWPARRPHRWPRCTAAPARRPPTLRRARALTGTGGGSRRRAVDAPGFGRHEDAARDGRTRRAANDRDESTRRAAETRGQDRAARRREPRTSVPLRCARSTKAIRSNESRGDPGARVGRDRRRRGRRARAGEGAREALAQSSPRDADDSKLTEAQRRFHRGIELYKEGDFAAAQVEFKRAYELVAELQDPLQPGPGRLPAARLRGRPPLLSPVPRRRRRRDPGRAPARGGRRHHRPRAAVGRLRDRDRRGRRGGLRRRRAGRERRRCARWSRSTAARERSTWSRAAASTRRAMVDVARRARSCASRFRPRLHRSVAPPLTPPPTRRARRRSPPSRPRRHPAQAVPVRRRPRPPSPRQPAAGHFPGSRGR